MNKKIIRLNMMILVVSLAVLFVFSNSRISFALYKANKSNRLVEEELFSNQEIYINDTTAIEKFYNYPIKEYNENIGAIIDKRDNSVLSGKKECDNYADLRLVQKEDVSYLAFDSSILSQYVDVVVKQASLVIKTRTSQNVDITKEISELVSNIHYSGLTHEQFTIPLSVAYSHEDNYSLELRIETYLPAQTTRSILSGCYFIYPKGTEDTFAFDANNNSAYQVFLWNFSGTNTQVWNFTYSSINGYYTVKNVRTGLYLKWDISDMDVTLDPGGVVGNYFTIDQTSSYTTIKPLMYSTRYVSYESLSNYSNIKLVTRSSSVTSSEKWDIIPVTTLGAAGSYRYVNTTDYRCYSYAMHVSSMMTVPGCNPSTFSSVDFVVDRVLTDSNLTSLGIHCRKLESGLNDVSYVKTTEYRVAVRVGYHIVNGKNTFDYHFMEQLCDGSWAHKPGPFASRNDVTNPETYAWNYYNPNGTVSYANFYDSAIIYLAVTIP